MKLGQQSWEKIIDSSWRWRVGLRFNLSLLRLDPARTLNIRTTSLCAADSSVSSVLSIEQYASVCLLWTACNIHYYRCAFRAIGHGRNSRSTKRSIERSGCNSLRLSSEHCRPCPSRREC
ncbi:hypothetical protein EDD17DRAFT_1133281 [Pisolithus thermaeus]|nr:hypothetical protein EDD17DRAFT_1133281 [Pisolithus thermaeus]